MDTPLAMGAEKRIVLAHDGPLMRVRLHEWANRPVDSPLLLRFPDDDREVGGEWTGWKIGRGIGCKRRYGSRYNAEAI
jgi:hypothetical protein